MKTRNGARKEEVCSSHREKETHKHTEREMGGRAFYFFGRCRKRWINGILVESFRFIGSVLAVVCRPDWGASVSCLGTQRNKPGLWRRRTNRLKPAWILAGNWSLSPSKMGEFARVISGRPHTEFVIISYSHKKIAACGTEDAGRRSQGNTQQTHQTGFCLVVFCF